MDNIFFDISSLKKCGRNVIIGKTVRIRYPQLVEIGDNVIIDDFTYISTGLIIQDFVHIGSHCSIIGGKQSKLIMRQFSGLSSGCHVICNTDDYLGEGLTNPTVPPQYRKAVPSFVELKKFSVIGTATTIHPGVVVGQGAACGSMTLVLKNLEDWWVYFGCPAVKYKKRNRENIVKLAQSYKGEG